ncbi:hypothetical protein C6H88_02870 [Chlamydia muridarum str. Nigg]|uniref:Membrane protein n=2 Tax=Chlamydia muridarum TaxID=83560 RepID=A0A070A2V2_CHLMR|nr:conserved hypothetical protein [Chlamydia muridarum str. Nigg]AHH22944.1 membrane protein [Chlamydia muridarum str. Nigg3 CMUT3-5]AHH23869.1 membrane protein [Chlamydia muridarum str. Nigg CM972]AID38077.1 membrane protein [Chlamydia muridarum str. Nigg 2 MCR]AIT90737.1 membrane protein [Chlamydia muridarum]UFW37697.1 hypothetical protein FTM86_02995 [Chlamydia trachomatis]
MLAFFNKHQKKFIGLVIAGVCLSGVGVGIGQTFKKTQKFGSNKTVYKTPSGRKYSEKEFFLLKRFLSNEAYPFTGNPKEWNFLNEGVLTERFLTNKLGEKLFLSVYKSGFPAFDKERSYEGYRRFDAPFISSEEVWKSSAPQLRDAFHIFQQLENPVSPEGFAARVRLFLEEKKFPHYVLRQMLEYRRQMFNLPVDGSLAQGRDLRLFGYRNIKDWFGDRYVSAVTEAVLRFIDEQKKNIAMPSLKEAQQDFYDKAQQAFLRLSRHAEFNLTLDQLVSSFYSFMGVEEAEFIRMYREILLYKRALLALEGAVAFDFYPLQKFFSMGKDTVSVEMFHLPETLVFKDKEDLEAFETYLSLVAAPSSHILDVQTKLLPIEKVKSKAECLVGKRFSVCYRRVKLSELEKYIPMAQVYQWYQNPENFEEILLEFPELETCSSLRDVLNLKPAIVERAHSYVRKAILRADLGIIQSELAKQEQKEEELFLSLGPDHLLPGIQNGVRLANVLMQQDSVDYYTQDDEYFYSIIVKNRTGTDEVLPYKEVVRKGLKKVLLERYKAEERITRVLAHLQEAFPNCQGKDLYQRRLIRFVKSLQSGRFSQGDLFWGLEKTVKTFSRGDQGVPQEFEEMLALKEGQVSDVLFDSDKGPFYYTFISKTYCDYPVSLDKLLFAKNHLNEELLRPYLSEIFFQNES